MLIKIRKRSDIKPSEITPESVYLRRREFMTGAMAVVAGAVIAPKAVFARTLDDIKELRPLSGVKKSPLSTSQEPNSYGDITSYNNFYEYGLDKGDPQRYAPGLLRVDPWNVEVSGECERPGTLALEDLLAPHPLEERIYPLRCVEAWSMVIPWVGIPLGDILKRFQPNSRAKYVELTTLLDPEQMPGQKRAVLNWPYTEGLRMDEAMHPLTILAVGLYGKKMPAQNGAPIRLIVPWKYGFKSGKSLVGIRFTEQQPKTSWNISAPREYGFYANVNPRVDHPRWSQSRERRIGTFFRRDTEMFNGYEEEVASLYAGMDLSRLENI